MRHLRLAFGYALCLAVLRRQGATKTQISNCREPSSDQPPPAASHNSSSTADVITDGQSPSQTKAEQIQALDLPKRQTASVPP
jgi:hypothetical protein